MLPDITDSTTKIQLRAFFRSQRLVPPAADHQALRTHVLQRLATLPDGLTIASFAGLPHEPQLLELISLEPRHRWLLPRVSNGEMSFHDVSDGTSELEIGPYGIRQPRIDCPVVALSAIDVALCPAEAFGRDGARLGKGGGYYDRFFQYRRRQLLLIGVGFNHQIIPTLPMEPHDLWMDSLISESGCSPCNRLVSPQ